jgi:hypothetical protein
MFTKKIILCIGIVGLLLGEAVFNVDASPVMSIGAPSSMSVGKTIAVDVRVIDVTDLYALQFDLTFNPAVFSASTITEGVFLPMGGTTLFIPGDIDNSAGTIATTIDTLVGPIAGVNGSGIVATFQFLAKATGVSQFSIGNALLLDSSLADINFTTGDDAVVRVVRTPESRTDILFMIGLISLFGLTWRGHSRVVS